MRMPEVVVLRLVLGNAETIFKLDYFGGRS